MANRFWKLHKKFLALCAKVSHLAVLTMKRHCVCG